jgi:hypothetical protein
LALKCLVEVFKCLVELFRCLSEVFRYFVEALGFSTMQHITGIPRIQMTFGLLEFSISRGNSSRFIDAFVDNINAKTILILRHKKRGYLILVIIFKTLYDNSISVDGMSSVPFNTGFIVRLFKPNEPLAVVKRFFAL